jgi:hypothetical protein
MTLPKKNRRNIVVDGHKYHWQFDPFRLWGNDSFVCVQDATGRVPLLKMQWVGIALPNHIEAAIRYAHANGWQPDGANILEIGANSNADPVTFRVKPDGASRYWYYDDFYGQYSPRNPNNPNLLRRGAEVETRNNIAIDASRRSAANLKHSFLAATA